MSFRDETLIAYVDRELDAESSAAIEAAASADPQLAERIQRHRALRNAVHAAYEPVLEEPLPQRLLDLASGAQPAAEVRARRWTWLEWSAIAVSLALGIGIGAAVLQAPSGELAAGNGRLVASGELATALSRQLASNQGADAPIRMGLTFISRDGKYCRTFLWRKGAQAGLACNDAGAWQIAVMTQAPAPTGEYRTAGAQMPTAVLRAVEERMQGTTLDAAGEQAARERGWRR